MQSRPKKQTSKEIEAIAEHVGTVTAMKYSEGEQYPRLLIDSSGYSSPDNHGGYAIVNSELMKKVHRTLASGDVVVCRVMTAPNGIVELVNFGIIKQYEPKQGEVRKLRIDHWEGQFRILGTVGSVPDVIDMSDDDWYLLQQGDHVYNLTWDANYMGGNGVMSIVRLGNTYYYDSECGVFGPFSSLREALHWSELDYFSSVTESIECSEMDSETLARLLQPRDEVEPGFKLWINDEEWVFSEQGTLMRPR